MAFQTLPLFHLRAYSKFYVRSDGKITRRWKSTLTRVYKFYWILFCALLRENSRGTLGNFWWGCAARFSKSWLASFQTIPAFKPDQWLILEVQQNDSLNPSFAFAYYSFLFMCSWNDRYVHHRRTSHEIIPDSRPKCIKSIAVFRPKRRKNRTFGATHTQKSYISKYSPPNVDKFPSLDWDFSHSSDTTPYICLWFSLP